MITRVTGRDFKGLTFNDQLGRFTLLVGPNGSGKSARTQAITLAVMGYIPGGAKQNAEILGAYGTRDTMVVGIDTGMLFERGFVRSASGSVAQGYKVGGEKKNEAGFMTALALNGNPKIVDVSLFMGLSDQKKVDAIFSLYPPAGDIRGIQADIDSAKAQISVLTAKKKSSEESAARLKASRPDVPPGSLAETTAKIAGFITQLEEAQGALVKAKVKAAEEAATKRAEEEAARKAEKAPEPEKAPPAVQAAPAAQPAPAVQEPTRRPPPFCVIAAVEEIIKTMDRAGCQACAAKLMANSIIKKLREV